ncbi:MAG TPA: SpoIIE family protein phosphatase, partial [Candidatus Elarobacter sp.]|nr:SpoIIE family protein phosphatase [Candidatus Elarobacter sp.]
MSFVSPPRSARTEFGTRGAAAAESALQGEMRRIVESVYGPPVRRLPGLDVGRAYRGAHDEFRYGGDMVDVFHYGNGCTSLAVVDITGHGIRAATNAGLAKHALRAYASRGFDARDSVRALNRLCIENSAFEGDEEFFATVFFAIVQPDRRTMQYVSAG